MKTFEELYHKLVKDSINADITEEMQLDYAKQYDLSQLDCLLNPSKHAPVWRLEDCDCSDEDKALCVRNCPFDAFTPDEKGVLQINKDLCVGCGICIDECKSKKLTESRDIIPALKAVRTSKSLTYALVAPAFLGQFSEEVTPGKLRSALKQVGFDGMVEVALFADILTLKEALEFDKNILTDRDFQLTSCCCPIWIAMIRKVYHDLMGHVPGSVSPMIACGRTIKKLHPDAVTVFIGPCVAKKSEAKEPDLVGAIDYVLTFRELQDIFDVLEINPADYEESEKDHSSTAGRIYARSNGVSEAVKATVDRITPNRPITVKTAQADGVPACKEMINKLLAGETTANFFEGMGCKGGCVGGPKAILDRETARQNVNTYGLSATYPTPADNPYVIELLRQLGFETQDSLIEDSDIFTRHFD